MLEISRLSKTFKNGRHALKEIDLHVAQGEIFALLGPNGAGKSTLVGAVCGLVHPSGGAIRIGGFDGLFQPKRARALVGLVPQELSVDAFSTVRQSVAFSRRLFGLQRDDGLVERLLTQLSLWDRRDSMIWTLSGGMKRRLLIAKALAHEPRLLFLDEPTAGVDVELRHDMWAMIRRLRDEGRTVVLTTHYLTEAEEIADRVGILSEGNMLLVESKTSLMDRLGLKEVTLHLAARHAALPDGLPNDLALAADGRSVSYRQSKAPLVTLEERFARLIEKGLQVTDVTTRQTTLEEIFVALMRTRP